MNQKINIAIAWMLLSPVIFARSAPALAAAFEGEMDFKVTEGKTGETALFTFFVKGESVRLHWKDASGRGAAMIIDNSRKKRYLLMDKDKKYMEMPVEATDSDDIQSKEKKERNMQFSKSGKTETILGYRCEQWIGKDDKGDVEVWGASGFGYFPGFQNSRKKAPKSAWEKEILRRGIFPLRMTEKYATGELKSKWEAARLDKKSLPDSTFRPPKDYAAMNMGDPSQMGEMPMPMSIRKDKSRKNAGLQNMSQEDMQKMVDDLKKKYSGGRP